MAYAHGITREDVFTAASAIFAAGKNPTQAAIRSALGKGSFSTISKHLAEWREQQTDTEAVLASTDDMPDQVRSLLNRTYAAIRSHAESTVVGEQTSLLEQENERLKDKLVHHDETVAELAGLRFAYQETITRLEQLTRENERIAKYLPQIDQVEELATKVGQMESENSEFRLKIEDLEVREARLQDQALTVQRNLATAIDRANGMEKDLHDCHTANTKLNGDLTRVSDRNLELNEKQESYETALTNKLAEIEELKNELKMAKQAPAATRKPRKTRSIQPNGAA